ncbi:MAG: hypothetical protein SGILL_000604 [Bacillariaceae sp.]
MFGGLEIKGNKDEGEEQEAPAPAAASSAFGFLNATTTTTTTEAAASEASVPASSFSFLNPGPAAAPAMEEPAPAASSGFSFMTTDATSAPAAPEPSPAEAPAPAASSGFDFLLPSPSNDNDSPAEAAPSNDVTSSDAPGASGFSFLSSPAPSTDTADLPLPEAPPMVTRDLTAGSTASSVVSAPSPTPPNFLETAAPPAAAAGLPTGAGITFGTSAKRNVVKKKKTRATRIGAGASGMPPMAPTAPAPAPTASTASAEAKSARDEALEAAKRAEQFMQSKAMEEAPSTSPARASPAPSPPRAAPEISHAASSDSVLAAAEAAAEEAKMLQQQQQKGGGSGFMGTFFKGFRASPNTTNGAMSHSSTHGPTGVSSQQTAAKRPPAPTAQIGKVDSDDDDDMVVVSSKVGGYVPEPIDSMPASASTFVPVTLPSAEVGSGALETKTVSAFAPTKSPVVRNFAVPEVKPPSSLPTPKKSKTPTETFEEYQALFAESVHRAMAQVDNVRSQQKMLMEERFVSLAKDRLAEQQIEQTEQQLQTAVEEEDYELADQLGQVVEGHKREKHEVGLMLENIAKAMAQLDSQKELVVQSVATCFDNLAVRLEELRGKEAASEQKDDEETLKQFASISKQLSAEQERLQQDLKHLERDEQLVSEERKELEDAIKEQTGEIEEQKEEATKKLKGVQSEIDELRKVLEAKQKEAATLRTEMFGFEDSISKVRVKFSRQLTRVDKKERALKESRSEWELEDSTHKKQKEAHELQVQSHSEALLAHDALMKTLHSELKLSKDFCELIPEQLGFMDDEKNDDKDEDCEEGDLAQLQADVVKCEAAVSEAKILLKAATSVLLNLQAEHDGLVARIPQLESLKKDAAAKRDFKSASKASKEIKDASARIKECEEELNGEAKSKKKVAEEELARLDAELVRTRELANEKEKVSGIEKMGLLAQKIDQLVEKKKEICGDSSSKENSVRGVGALVLEGQVKALKAEGQDLGSKYGGWTDLMKNIQMDGEDDDIEPSSASPCPDTEKADTHVTEVADMQESAPVNDGLTVEERINKVKSLVARLKTAEQALEIAAADEDFDRAAEQQELIESLASDIADIDLPEDVLAIAVAGDDSEEDVEEDLTTEVAMEVAEEVKDEEEKKDAVDEEAIEVSEEETDKETDTTEKDDIVDETNADEAIVGDAEDEAENNTEDDNDLEQDGVEASPEKAATDDEFEDGDGSSKNLETGESTDDADDKTTDSEDLVLESVSTDDAT